MTRVDVRVARVTAIPAIHPGEHLAEELAELGFSAAVLSLNGEEVGRQTVDPKLDDAAALVRRWLTGQCGLAPNFDTSS